jgi:hypothetical protein
VVRGGARADDSSLHILGLAQLGATDNLTSGEHNPTDPMAPVAEWDTYLGIRPGVLATYGTPSAIHELTYTLDATLYARHGQYSSLFHRASWRGFFLIGPRSEVITSLEGSFGDGNLFPTVSASSAQIGAQRSGNVETLGGAATEDYSYQLDRDLRFTQGFTERYDRTSTEGAGVSRASETGLRLGLDKSFRYDAMSLLVGASYLSLERPDLGTMIAKDQIVNARGTLMYRRDVSRFWTAIGEGGAVAVLPAGGNGKAQVVPVGGASLAYFPAWGTATLSVRRDVTPNLLIARNTLTDSGVVSCWLPLPWLQKDPTNPELSFEGTLGYARTRLIDTDMGTVVQGFGDFVGDAAVNWNFRKNAGLSFRYQLVVQSSDTAMTSAQPVFPFVRNTVLVQFFGRWPEKLAVEVPVRNTLRVDRSNVNPVGEEVPGANGAGATGGGSGGR